MWRNTITRCKKNIHNSQLHSDRLRVKIDENNAEEVPHMTTLEILDRLQGDALKDGELRKKLLATRLEKDPLTVFSRLCRSLGYELYEMDLVSAGEDFYATMLRSTNGGGENSPKLEGEDDFYELLMASLEAAEKAE